MADLVGSGYGPPGLVTDDTQHVQIVDAYLRLSGAFDPASAQLRTPPGPGDPLYAVWAATPAPAR